MDADTDAAPAPVGLAVWERSYGRERRRHRHPFVQAMFPLAGALSLAVGDEAGRVGGGWAAVVAPGIDHAYWADGPNRMLIADLPADIAGEWPAPGPFLRLEPRLGALSLALRAELASGGLADRLVAEALGRYAAAALLRAGPPERAIVSPGGRILAARAEEYLRAHFADDLSVAVVAAAVGASPGHLQRCFRAHAGCSLVAFVHRLRLEHARDLLAATDRTVADIAQEVGFASQSHLTRLFVRRFGAPPGRYRTALWARSGTNRGGSGKTG